MKTIIQRYPHPILWYRSRAFAQIKDATGLSRGDSRWPLHESIQPAKLDATALSRVEYWARRNSLVGWRVDHDPGDFHVDPISSESILGHIRSRRDPIRGWLIVGLSLYCASFSAMRTRSARESACIFSMTWRRWSLMVISLVPNWSAICLLSIPLTTRPKTSVSRGVSE
jgi:hypothetical protein